MGCIRMHSVWRAFYTTYIWMVVHMLLNGSQWLEQRHIVVINGITIYIYVIHWDALSYHTGSAAHHIRLHIVILCAKWRYIRDSRTIYWIVHGTWTWWVGAFRQANLGNVIRKFRGIVTAQTAHLNGNFTHLCGNSTISVKNTANPCNIRVSRGWNKGIHCHNTVESTWSLVNQRFRHGDTGDT